MARVKDGDNIFTAPQTSLRKLVHIDSFNSITSIYQGAISVLANEDQYSFSTAKDPENPELRMASFNFDLTKLPDDDYHYLKRSTNWFTGSPEDLQEHLQKALDDGYLVDSRGVTNAQVRIQDPRVTDGTIGLDFTYNPRKTTEDKLEELTDAVGDTFEATKGDADKAHEAIASLKAEVATLKQQLTPEQGPQPDVAESTTTSTTTSTTAPVDTESTESIPTVGPDTPATPEPDTSVPGNASEANA